MRAVLVIVCALCISGALAQYDPNAAASTSDSMCSSSPSGCDDTHFGCCTDLVIAALQAGGYSGPTDRGAANLASDLVSSGWSSNGCTGATSCNPGDVLFYPNLGDGHVAMCSSGGSRNQWNPPRCAGSVDWSGSGGLYCISAPQSVSNKPNLTLSEPAMPAKPSESKCITEDMLNAAVDRAVNAAMTRHSSKLLMTMQIFNEARDDASCDYITCAEAVLQCVESCKNGATAACVKCVGDNWGQCCSCFKAC